MIVLDTNVISEIIKPVPSQAVLGWLGSRPAKELMITAITKAEMWYGLALLPAGKKRDALANGFGLLFEERFAGRVLDFDGISAPPFGEIMASHRRMGRAISEFDGLIAAITRANRATLATRNVSDFEHCGIEVINPWDK